MQYLVVSFLLILALANGSTIKGRIIGGQIVDKQTFPQIISLRSHDQHTCGGSIIDQDTILTAAHCIEKGNASQYSVRSGSDSADDGIFHQVYKIQKHPHYNPKIQTYDVAKLKITPPIIYSTKSQPIKLATERPDDNASLIVCGWGRQNTHMKLLKEQREHLRAATVKSINQDDCSRMYQPNQEINNFMICAAALGKDSCQGDSGGPLIDPSTGKQVGICSFGIGCANPKYPGVYASVADLLDFIQTS